MKSALQIFIFIFSVLTVVPSYAEMVADAHAGTPNSQLSDIEQEARGNYCINQCGSGLGSCYTGCLQNGQVPAANQAAAQTCSQKLSGLITTCGTTTTEATNSCDDTQNSGMAQAQQAAVVLGQQVSSSVTAACSAMGKISQAANAATAAYQINCASSVSDCSSACQSAIAYYQQTQGCASSGGVIAKLGDMRAMQKTCTDLSAKSQAAQQAIQNFIATTAQAQNCEAASSGTTTTLPEICKTNPNIAGCTDAGPVDCTKPEMASNKVCVCSKNPNDPSCNSGQSSNAGNSVTDGASFASRTGAGADGGLDGDNFGLPGIQQAPLNKSAAEAAIDGKQGAGAQFGSTGADGSGGAGSGKGGAGKEAEAIGVNAGFYGGGGSSGGSGGGGSSSGEGREAVGAFAVLAEKAAKGLPDLKQFLPGGSMDPKARGIAGAAGPDGITGPNSNIWQKIQNRYQVVAPSLMP